MKNDSYLKALKTNADEAADFVRLLSNNKRLLILYELMSYREMSVGPLADVVGISRSAMSQHLAKFRAEGLVKTRRKSQSIFYRLSQDVRVRHTTSLLKQLFCR
jgi:DNA-binding transcriptional ArsR family regulator